MRDLDLVAVGSFRGPEFADLFDMLLTPQAADGRQVQSWARSVSISRRGAYPEVGKFLHDNGDG